MSPRPQEKLPLKVEIDAARYAEDKDRVANPGGLDDQKTVIRTGLIQPRSRDILIDLSRYFNVALDPDLNGYQKADLSLVPRGNQTLAGTTFDVRGLIQLGSGQVGSRYPSVIAGIKINEKCRRIHFLHAAVSKSPSRIPEGSRIGKYTVRLSNGEPWDIPIVYGRDVLDFWLQSPNKTSSVTPRIAWQGYGEDGRIRVSPTLYKSTWDNPFPDVPVESLQFASSTAAVGPMLCAITLETMGESVPSVVGEPLLPRQPTSPGSSVDANSPVVHAPSESKARIVRGVVPVLLSPDVDASLDNGRRDRRDDIVWDFHWSDVPRAVRYRLLVKNDNASRAVVDESNISTNHFRRISKSGYIDRTNGWSWKVQTLVNGVWGPWSERRRFNVEQVDSDPPADAKTIGEDEDRFPDSSNTNPVRSNSVGAYVRGSRWTNSLGMVIVRVGDIWFSAWETRVKDFEPFVTATGHDSTIGMVSISRNSWKVQGHTWRNPGFPQGPTHPVVGVSWNDANAFCDWLTKKERSEMRITEADKYRLPTDAEWSMAAAEREQKFPWGNDWPPPADGGNYAGSEAQNESWVRGWPTMKDHRDEFPRTAPVGSFKPNKFGIYDLGGNVWEWCLDKHNGSDTNRIARGATWFHTRPEFTQTSYRIGFDLNYRVDDCGFRCVLAKTGSAFASRTESVSD